MAKHAILFIDDEKIVLSSLKGQFKRHFGSEYQFEFAESAEEGLEMVEELVGDGVEVLLIVSDWLMPGMKGDEFLVQVESRHPQVVKIMLTGHATEEAITRAKSEANLYKLVKKPWDEDELMNSIRDGLRKGQFDKVEERKPDDE